MRQRLYDLIDRVVLIERSLIPEISLENISGKIESYFGMVMMYVSRAANPLS